LETRENNRFEALNGDDVVSVNPETFENLDISHTSRVVHLLAALQEYFYHATNEAILFTEGKHRDRNNYTAF
jgi:hypothetical protein